MKDARDIKIRVEMSLEDLGCISLALDYQQGHDSCVSAETSKLQLRYDEIYRAAHKLRERGVTVLA